jgi:hypothetical protein
VVAFPQAPELSTDHPPVAKNHRQGFAQEKPQSVPGQTDTIHTSTTPYYD